MPHTLLYGGTFDPIHLGHLITCQAAREHLAADRVLFLPARISPHKTALQSSSGDDRLAMIRLAISDNPFFAADSRELELPPPSYTFNTLASLRHDYPTEKFTLLIGADQLPQLHTWHRIHELLHLLDFAILDRPHGENDAATGLDALAENLGPDIIDQLAAAILPTPLIEISATAIRHRVAANLPIDYLVLPAVADYIRTYSLYKSAT